MTNMARSIDTEEMVGSHRSEASAPAGDTAHRIDLSVLIPALNEGQNLAQILPKLRALLDSLQITHELLVVTRDADELTRSAVATAGGQVLEQAEDGYGGALITGFSRARGEYILTMDADTSHRPGFVENLWKSRANAEITIASRYTRGGSARMPFGRYVLSRALNWFFGLGLNVPIRDLSSGFRLYKSVVLRQQTPTARDFDILQQIVVRAYAEGWKVQEIPFAY
jgi:dolichol-phosphate mannosyltransferase